MLYYTKTVRQTLDELQSSELGLAISEAEERLRLKGPNSIRVSSESIWRKIIEPFANPSMVILIAAAAISIFRHTILDAVIISTIILVSAVIYYVQRFSTERILRSLRKHEEQRVDVLRDEKNITISSTLLVPGDVMTLREGDKVPADARIITGRGLRIDEAQLTGESIPVDKQTVELSGEKEVYEQTNMLFQGSFVVSGEAIAVVIATGNETEFGRLAQLTKDTPADSPVQQKIDKVISQIITAIAGIAIVVFLLSLYRGTTIADSLQFVLALSVSAVPEDLPIAVSIILVLGMRRMAHKKALVRTMRSIESIGVITTIATDKTGTLTKNQLTIQDVWHYQNSHSRLSHTIARAANQSTHNHGDPLDAAFLQYAEAKNISPSHHQPLLSLPFDQEVAMSGNLWHNGAEYDLAIKGAPEHVLLHCDLTESEHEQASMQLHKFTGNGYRVIAVAHVTLKKPITEFSELHKRDKLTLDGFVAVADVLRPEAKSAIQTALRAGVSVRMITGDHFETAYHIARQLGMVHLRDQVFDARHMNVMSDEQLEGIIEGIRVFSRVTPDHKYRILALLKKHNITAMTGDGVNDVPALTNAHVGVAMGSGAQIAKDAGDIILINDNFKGIVDAMREGRTIIANIRRMLVYLLATNTGEVLTTIAALVVGLPIPLVPVQILWVNLVTDTAMVIPLGLEPGERSTMRRHPDRPDAPLLDAFLISRIVLIAITMAALTLSMYAFFMHWYGAAYGRTIAFTALVVMQWASAISLRSDDEPLFMRLRVFNGKFYTGLTIAATLQLFAIFTPFGTVLHVSPVALPDLAITSLIALVIPIAVIEVHKYIGRRFLGRSQTAKNSRYGEFAHADSL